MVSLADVKKQATKKTSKLLIVKVLPETDQAFRLNGVDAQKLAGLLLDEWAAKELKVAAAPKTP
jgi:hypothetical protein